MVGEKLLLKGSGTYLIHLVTLTLISNLATDYIQKRRGQALLFSFEYNHVAKFDNKGKVTTWIGQYSLLVDECSLLCSC